MYPVTFIYVYSVITRNYYKLEVVEKYLGYVMVNRVRYL